MTRPHALPPELSRRDALRFLGLAGLAAGLAPSYLAAATPSGIIATARPKGLIVAVSTMSPPHSKNAPTASFMLIPVVAAIKAAPGVDHAKIIGTRLTKLSPAEPRAKAMQIAKTQLAVWAGLACKAAAAESTKAIVEP